MKHDDFSAYLHYLREVELEDYAYRYVEDHNDAKDVADWTIAEAFNREAEFDASTGPEGLRKWVREICRKQALSYVSFAKWDESPVFSDQAHRYESTDLDKLIEDENEKRATLMYILMRDSLTTLQRKCFEAMLAGETQTQTAKRLNISPQTVSQHIQYAHKKLGSGPRERGRAKQTQPYRARPMTPNPSRRFMDDLLVTILEHNTVTSKK